MLRSMNNTKKRGWWPLPGLDPQGQYLHDMTPEDRRTTFVQIARSSVGMHGPTMPYLNLLYPGDRIQHQRIMVQSQHGCALGCAGWIRCGGCFHPVLSPPYHGRTDAFSRLEVLARGYEGCWGGHDGEFDEGDILMIGTDVPRDFPNRAKTIAAWGTPGHAMLVEKIEDKGDGKLVIHTIDAGRGPIERKTRRVEKDNRGRVWVTGLRKRRIWGSIRVANLGFDPHEQWCLPKGPNYPGLK